MSNETTGDGGADLVLQRTRDELNKEFSDAPWLGAAARKQLLDELAALDAQTDRNTPAFGVGRGRAGDTHRERRSAAAVLSRGSLRPARMTPNTTNATTRPDPDRPLGQPRAHLLTDAGWRARRP